VKTIVTAGKGGTGKSMILNHLLQRHVLSGYLGRILVVDADPHQSLTRLLEAEPRATLGELRHRYAAELSSGKGLGKQSRRDFARELAQDATVAIEGADLLVMGHDPDPGCQCVVNNILGSTLDNLAVAYDWVIVDNEAGIEPIGRHGWRMDYLLLISSPRPLEMDVIHKILQRRRDVQRELGCACLLLNRGGKLQGKIPSGTALLGSLPFSVKLATEELPDEVWLSALDQAWKNFAVLIWKQKLQIQPTRMRR
jgi:CO dehydrogenase maturation factor